MAASNSGKGAELTDPTALPESSATEPALIDELFRNGPSFDFFQALRLLARQENPRREPVGGDGPPSREIARIGALASLAFPASSVHAIEPPAASTGPPRMTITFLGMIGPSGVLPRHYTKLLLEYTETQDERKGKQTLRAWLDLFTHRWASFFYRAWEKYRFFVPFERGEHDRATPDAFTQCLYSLMGMGFRTLRNRLRVAVQQEPGSEHVLDKIDDLALPHFSGLLAHRPRCAVSLELFLRSFLGLPVEVRQFQGQWLHLEASSQSALGKKPANNCLGTNALVGDRIWDVSKIRVRLGPLDYSQFVELLPDRTPTERQKRLFLVAQLVRLFVGQEHDVEFQLVLRKDEVPVTRMGGAAAGTRLGWNTWMRRKPMACDADDPVFQADERVTL